MRTVSLISGLVLAGVLAASAHGGELTKIQRTIAKEPAYTSKPKYCLLVFGPEAKTRVWLVLDGDTLYADKNGNGDLTEEGERFVRMQDEYDRKRGKRLWQVGDITTPDGKTRYTDLKVCEIAEGSHVALEGMGVGHGVIVNVPVGKDRVPQSAGCFLYAHHGFRLLFGARPEDAPIIHFAGPLRMIVIKPDRLSAGLAPGAWYHIEARVGTPGLGKDTAALIDSDVPLGASSDALTPMAVCEFEFPTRTGEKERLRQRLVFD
jgi:hypothetical protein